MDEPDFERFFAAHFDPIWRFARRRCSCAADADDLTSETFAVAWRRRDQLPDGDDARLWLFGAARLALANHRRSARRRSSLDARVESEAMAAGPTEDPAQIVVGREDQTVGRALASLDSDDRDLLMMRAWDGLAVSVIAELLGATPNAVSVRLHKARKRLTVALDEQRDANGALDETEGPRCRTGTGRPQHPEGERT